MTNEQKRNFLLYSAGRLVSLIGTGVQMIALPLYILDLTGSGTLMGTFALLSMLPGLIFSPIAGVLGDRRNRKKIMVNMDYLRGIIILFMAYSAYQGWMNIAFIFTAQVFISILDSVFGGSTNAMLPDLVPIEFLTKANSLNSSINGISNIIGPILGGIIYGFGGIKVVFLINGISFVISAISEMFITYVPHFEGKQKISFKSMFSDIKEGLVFIRGRKGLKELLLFALVVNFLMAPILTIVLPYVLRQEIGFTSEQYGITQSSFTVGILIGSILIGTIFSKSNPKKSMTLGLTVEAVMFFIISGLFFPNIVTKFGGASWTFLIILYINLMIIGVSNAFINIPIDTNMQKMTPTNVRSRVFTVLGLIAQGAVPVGMQIYGILLDLMKGYQIALFASIVSVIVIILFLKIAPEETFNPKPVSEEA
ncbi:major facilitator superfamily MFS_1 [Petrotoga mobilis SJ95]|jgi:MFS family permease|uniref:Major facilitator superfamily MFS_1 n=1 Tax=Petrotoga mobilis (strain DSM 10674 / SJ95) TaxID=403833 RepID=A9BIS0_PETMO|nr:MFS transporter [Petrotoga mobilis]ABX32233.1 major facilitator superfamily MFS_1 [Petrotoga mobilis SJ95]